ncbi:G-protein coupled receptor [Colletotrichum higginsianum]|uniref:G-protein coupled receptor n=2 Tax=Colletotrichum higginsianum TaxID=80884 RepID=H1VIV6_COLHI|nr:G-protein coupled receptor [Colletotrichum higginsianum IMI 349063]OBR04413.1 G-protein coupled receptor [Colletotrichum higginsianum IMI 349063]TIC89670.1 Cyclic AMP receptor-like protein A [Colletotrichum higginsianum]CCF40159.1 G-protein coupled receptor [Colletotrichum higginsianum]
MSLTHYEIEVVTGLERVGSALSLVGVTLIFITYWKFKRIRSVPNLFIVFASIANVGASVACAIGYEGLRMGETSALCQAQAFLLEMFMQSDPWWSFAMAVNVYLVFFAGANPSSFREYLWVYCAVCFGFPLVPALVCLFLRPHGPNDYIYGNATLWCWINKKWGDLRIFTYYIPIWFCVLGSSVIYFAVGYHVFHHRNQLHNLTFSNNGCDGKEMTCSDERDSAEKVSYLSRTGTRDDCPLVDTRQNLTGRTEFYGTAVTEVQITTMTPKPWTPQPPPVAMTKVTAGDQQPRHQRSWRTSEDDGSPGPRFETTCTSDPPPPKPRLSVFQRIGGVRSKFSSRLQRLDPVKLAYLRTSFIFAISVLVTWTPSSINRVFNMIRRDESHFGLNVASATVLPLQGVWNAVIFFMTSWTVFKEEWKDMRGRHQVRLGSCGEDGLHGGLRIEVLRGDQQDRFKSGRYGHTKTLGSDQTSDIELTPPSGVGNVRAMRGSFSI